MLTAEQSKDTNTRAFTLVELMAAIAIIAVLAVTLLGFVGSYIAQAEQTADRQTLTVLNDALTRYKTMGGDLTALTAGAPPGNILQKLKETVSWAGIDHSFLNQSVTCSADSLMATGSGARYRFTSVGSYTQSQEVSWADATSSDLEVTTWAGNGTATFVEGYRLDSGFIHAGAVLNKGGIIYFLSASGAKIYQIDHSGHISNYSSVPSWAEGLALGPDGNLYIAATGAGTIYKVTAPDTYEIFAGTGTSGYLDGDRLSAQFTYVIGQCWDAAGNMYVTEFNKGRVRKIDANTGQTSTIATGLGTGIYSLTYRASDNSLLVGQDGAIKEISLADYSVNTIITGGGAFYGIVLDSNENMYFTNRTRSYIGKVPAGGNTYEIVAGTYDVGGYQDGAANTALFTSPNQLCWDNDGNLLIGEYGTLNYIRKVYIK